MLFAFHSWPRQPDKSVVWLFELHLQVVCMAPGRALGMFQWEFMEKHGTEDGLGCPWPAQAWPSLRAALRSPGSGRLCRRALYFPCFPCLSGHLQQLLPAPTNCKPAPFSAVLHPYFATNSCLCVSKDAWIYCSKFLAGYCHMLQFSLRK